MGHVDFGTSPEQASFQVSDGLTGQVQVLQVQNAQSIATPSPFQLMVSFNPSTFKFQSQLATDLGNIRFYSDSSLQHILLSWVESGTSSSTNALIWVLLPNGIGANTTITIYMAVSPGQEFDGINAGQAPQLSSTYAKYDNGASVFPLLYQNFAGTSIPSGWTTAGSPVINNGVTTTFVSGTTQWILTTASFAPSTDILDIYGYQNYNGTNPAEGNTGVGYIDYPNDAAPVGWMASGFNVDIVDMAYSTKGSISIIANGTNHVYSTSYTGTGAGTFSLDYGSPESLSGGSLSGSTPISAGFTWRINSAGSVFTQWIRLRAYPPNGVQPTVIFL